MNSSRIVQVSLPHVDIIPPANNGLYEILFTRKRCKPGLLLQRYSETSRSRSSSTVRLRRKGEMGPGATQNPQNSPKSARKQRTKVYRGKESLEGDTIRRSCGKSTSPSLTLLGRTVRFVPALVLMPIRHPGSLSEQRLKVRKSESQKPAELLIREEASFSSDDSTPESQYMAMYPKLLQTDETQGMTSKKTSRTDSDQSEIMRLFRVKTDKKAYIYFRPAKEKEIGTMETGRGTVAIAHVTRSCGWLFKCLKRSGMSVSKPDPDKECLVRLAPKGDPKHLINLRGGKYNHIPGCNLLFNQFQLYSHLKESSPSGLFFLPPCFNTVSETFSFLKYRSSHPKTIWISRLLDCKKGSPKPVFPNDDFAYKKDSGFRPKMLRKYMSRPHLYEGRKYFLGFFLLVTSFSPLIVYISDSLGIAYIAKEQFSMSPESFQTPGVHMISGREEKEGEILPLDRLREWYETLNIDFQGLVRTVADISVRILLTFDGKISTVKKKYPDSTVSRCFEIVEIDFLLDRRLRPWAKSPDWTSPIPIPQEVLDPLICGSLNIAGITLDSQGGNPSCFSPFNPETSAVARLDDEVSRQRQTRTTCWERIFPTSNSEKTLGSSLKDSSGINVFLCNYLKTRTGTSEPEKTEGPMGSCR